MKQISALIGSGHRIGLTALPFATVGLAANILRPAWFDVGGPPDAWRFASAIVLVPGVIVWVWSVALIATKVPRGQLITSGPFALIKHPLYTAVSLLVLPAAGFLLNTWLGLAIGLLVYAASRMHVHTEEEDLQRTFGSAWNDYVGRVLIPWL